MDYREMTKKFLAESFEERERIALNEEESPESLLNKDDVIVSQKDGEKKVESGDDYKNKDAEEILTQAERENSDVTKVGFRDDNGDFLEIGKSEGEVEV